MSEDRSLEQLMSDLEQKHSRGQAGEAGETSTEKTKAEVVQLPLWSQTDYGIPTSILQSSLFAPVQPGRRRNVGTFDDFETLAAWPGLVVNFKGKQLDQNDLDTLLQAIQIHQSRGDLRISEYLPIRIKGFLRGLGRGAGQTDREWLHGSMERLMEGTVYISGKRDFEYRGHLIDDFFHSDEHGSYVIRVNPYLSRMFRDAWTKLNQQERRELGNQAQLTKALHAFINSHTATKQKPLFAGFERLAGLFGQNYDRRRNFKAEIRTVLNDLKERRFILQWYEKGDTVYIIKANKGG